MTTKFYPKGTALILTEGEYSDFGVCACLVTIEDCDLPALVQKFLEPHKDLESWDVPGPSDFAAWLVTSGLAMPMKAEECHIGSYGRIEL